MRPAEISECWYEGRDTYIDSGKFGESVSPALVGLPISNQEYSSEASFLGAEVGVSCGGRDF